MFYREQVREIRTFVYYFAPGYTFAHIGPRWQKANQAIFDAGLFVFDEKNKTIISKFILHIEVDEARLRRI